MVELGDRAAQGSQQTVTENPSTQGSTGTTSYYNGLPSLNAKYTINDVKMLHCFPSWIQCSPKANVTRDSED